MRKKILRMSCADGEGMVALDRVHPPPAQQRQCHHNAWLDIGYKLGVERDPAEKVSRAK